jgi:DNA end-binding protein Ku
MRAAAFPPSYVVLRDAMVEQGKTALVRFTLRQRESLTALRPRGDIFILDTMLWADEIRVIRPA